MTDDHSSVEAVARAICRAENGGPLGYFADGSPMRDGGVWEEYDKRQHEEWFNAARAAIAAMPTPANQDKLVGELVEAGRFLLDRLVDHEVRTTSDEDSREWHGHVTPAMARFRAAITRARQSGRAEQ